MQAKYAEAAIEWRKKQDELVSYEAGYPDIDSELTRENIFIDLPDIRGKPNLSWLSNKMVAHDIPKCSKTDFERRRKRNKAIMLNVNNLINFSLVVQIQVTDHLNS